MTEAVKEYAVAVTIFCIAAGLCEIMVPDSGGSIGKYVRYVISLCVAAVILLPLGKAFTGTVSELSSEIPAVSGYTKEDVADVLVNEFRREVERKAEESAEKNFSLREGEVRVSVALDMSDLSDIAVLSAFAYLSGGASDISGEIAEYLSFQLGCGVTVING